jgi:hypothetical protein
MHKFTGIENEIIEQILASKRIVKIAVAWFTNITIFEAVEKAQESGVEIRLIVVNDRINNKELGVDFQKVIDKGGRFYFSDIKNLVHHKFCIIDDEVVITGSYNWTYYAENRNWENIVILTDTRIVKGYVNEFNKIEEYHEKVISITESTIKDDSVVDIDYLKEDYLSQANSYKKKGDLVKSAKVYTKLLDFVDDKKEIIIKRDELLDKIHAKTLKSSPFEIGILYRKGYEKAIPASVKLPFEIRKRGSTVADNQTAIHVIIQKFDVIATTILELHLGGMQKSPKATNKIEHIFCLGLDGYLDLTCNELDGSATTRARINIRDWM